MRLKFKSMRTRTTAGFVVIIAVVLAFLVTAVTSLARNSGEYENQELLRGIGRQARDAMQSLNWKTSLETLAASNVVTSKNISLAVYQRPPRQAHPDQGAPPEKPILLWQSSKNMPPPRPRGAPGKPDTVEQRQWDAQWRADFEPAPDRKFVLVTRPISGFLQDVEHRRRDMIMMAILVVFAVGVGAWLVVGKTLSPISQLAQQAANTSAEDLDTRLAPPSNDHEVVELVDTLNGFLERIAQTAESKGRFYAAASHELRTPLQALSGHLELALSRERSALEYRSALEEANKQSKRLKSLVQSLLLLHQLENNTAHEPEIVDLASIVGSGLAQLQSVATLRKIRLDVDLQGHAQALAIGSHADILVRNILENALKYGTEGGEVRVALRSSKGFSELEVFDECEEIPNWDASDSFEAFYRPDAARNAKTGGNGLGLAICRAVAKANRWEFVADQVPGGFLAKVRFPLGTSSEAEAPLKTSGKSLIRPAADSPIA